MYMMKSLLCTATSSFSVILLHRLCHFDEKGNNVFDNLCYLNALIFGLLNLEEFRKLVPKLDPQFSELLENSNCKTKLQL